MLILTAFKMATSLSCDHKVNTEFRGYRALVASPSPLPLAMGFGWLTKIAKFEWSLMGCSKQTKTGRVRFYTAKYIGIDHHFSTNARNKCSNGSV